MPLSEETMKLLMGPKALIVLTSVIGLVGWGPKGLVGGAALGFLVALLLGVLIGASRDGSVLRRVKRDLVADFIQEQPELARAAYPGMSGADRFEALERDVEAILTRAVRKAVAEGRRHEQLLAADNILGAAQLLISEEEDPARRQLLEALARRVMRHWNTPVG